MNKCKHEKLHSGSDCHCSWVAKKDKDTDIDYSRSDLDYTKWNKEEKSTDRYPTFSDILANPAAHMPTKKK